MIPNRRIQVPRELIRMATSALAEDVAATVLRRAELLLEPDLSDLTLADLLPSNEEPFAGFAHVEQAGFAIEIYAFVKRSESPKLVISGEYQCNPLWPEEVGTIAVRLNGRYPAESFLRTEPSSGFWKDLYVILAHELAHAFDPGVRKLVCTRGHAEDYYRYGAEYWNEPSEVKAFAAQVIEEILPVYEKLVTKRGIAAAARSAGKPIGRYVLDLALRQSERWQVITVSPMTQRNRNRILRDVYAELTELGLA